MLVRIVGMLALSGEKAGSEKVRYHRRGDPSFLSRNEYCTKLAVAEMSWLWDALVWMSLQGRKQPTVRYDVRKLMITIICGNSAIITWHKTGRHSCTDVASHLFW